MSVQENKGHDGGSQKPAEAQIRRHEGQTRDRQEDLSRAVYFLLCLIRDETRLHHYSLRVTRAQCADKRLEEALEKENEVELMHGLASHNVFVHEFRASKKGSNDPKDVLIEVQWGDGSDESEDEEDEFQLVTLGNEEQKNSVGKEEVSSKDKGKGRPRSSISQGEDLPKPRPSLSSIRPRLSHAPPPGISVKNGSLKDILLNLTVQTIAAENWTRSKLILVNANQIVEKALNRFNVHSISSVPVADITNKGVVGIIDVCSIVKYLASTYNEDAKSSTIKSEFFNKKINEVLEGTSFLRVPILILPHFMMVIEIRPRAFIISMESNIMFAAQQLVENNVERLIIVDRPIVPRRTLPLEEPEHSVIGLLTQSDLIRFLSQNVGWMKKEPLFAKSIGQIGLGSRKPKTVNQNLKTVAAFTEIARNPAEGAAVVDDDGQLVGNLSASDIRGMNKRVFSMIFKPLREYLQRDKRRGWWMLPIIIRLTDTLEHVIFQFVATKVHRMYVTDENNRPIGEVNLGDVLRVIVENLTGTPISSSSMTGENAKGNERERSKGSQSGRDLRVGSETAQGVTEEKAIEKNEASNSDGSKGAGKSKEPSDVSEKVDKGAKAIMETTEMTGKADQTVGEKP